MNTAIPYPNNYNPNMMFYNQNFDIFSRINQLEEKINYLDKKVNDQERRIRALESTKVMPLNNNYDNFKTSYMV